MVTARDVDQLVDERQDLREAITTVLDAEQPFTFDEIAVDSGRFGELVAAGIVEKQGNEYRIADRGAVERGLAGETATESVPTNGMGLTLAIDRQLVLALAGALAFVAVLRTGFAASAVFRDGAVVLSGNDPYYYRYWVEQLLANPEVTLSSLPDGVTKGEPLYIVTMWALASLLGGSPTVAGWLLAWYPVVSACLSGILVYLLAVETTGDRRVGLAAVLMLGVVAGHAFRTSLGFADHHAFDYPWLGLTALSMVVLVRSDLRSLRTGVATGGLAVGVAGQVLAWEAGPLLILPVGLAIAAVVVVWVDTDVAPLRAGAPLLGGLGVAAALVWGAHAAFGWHTAVVASAPALLCAGSCGVVGVGALVSRVRPDARVAAGAVGASGLASVAGVLSCVRKRGQR